MKKYILLAIATLLFACGIVTANAQIPAEVSALLKKSSVAMSDPTGVEYEMDIKVKMLVVTVLNGKMTVASLGEKNRYTMTVKAMGQEMITEGGFDGEYEWEHTKGLGADTLYITKTNKKTSGEYDIDFDLDQEYRKASMKKDGDYYVIDFSDPKDSEAPGKVTMTINAKNYYFHEMKTSKSGATMSMTLTKVRTGVQDGIFSCDPKKYPQAAVVRK
jgi:outer membrane lipoprotein-sorting protein